MKKFFGILRELKAINIPHGWQRGEREFFQRVKVELGSEFPNQLEKAYDTKDQKTLMNLRGDIRRLIKKELRSRPEKKPEDWIDRADLWLQKKTRGWL